MWRTAIEKLCPISDEEWADLQSCLLTFEFSREEYLLQEGKTERYLYLVESGIQRMFYLSPRGQEFTMGFTYNGDFSGSYQSYLTQKPSIVNVKAITASRLQALPIQDWRRLLDQYKSFERWGRLFAEQILFGRALREVELLSLNAKERYDLFLQRIPFPLHQVPQKHLASYLNMTPETFSRLRNKSNS